MNPQNEKVVSNYEFKFILKKGEEEYDLGLADSITDAWTTTTAEVPRFEYKGVIGQVPVSANFQVTVTGINDQNNATYKLFKSLYGGSLLDLQGFQFEMTWPLADDEESPQILTCPASISFSAGFSAAANDLSRFSIDIFANGEITVTQAVKKDDGTSPVQLSSILTNPILGELPDNEALTIAGKIIELNSPITMSDFQLANRTETGCDANGTGDYTGTVSVTYTISEE